MHADMLIHNAAIGPEPTRFRWAGVVGARSAL